MSQCPSCGALLPTGTDRTCPNCGATLPAPPPPPIPPSPLPGPPPTRFGASAGERRAAASTPWERRSELGFIPAIVETTRQVLFGPEEFFRRMPVEGGIGSPLGYAMIVGYAGLLVAAMYQAVMQIVLGSTLAELGERGPLGRFAPFIEGGGGFVAQVVFGPVFLLLGLFLSAGIYHLVLLLLGAANRGFEATFRTVCYGQASSVLLVIPFCGGLIAFVWWLAVVIIGLAEAHGISRGRSAIAVLAPLLLCCCCCGAVGAVVFGGLASALGHAR